MKTVVMHVLVFLLVCYIYDFGASALNPFPRHQQDSALHSGNTTLTLFEKIRRFKEAFREMIRTKFQELRTATTGMAMTLNSTHPVQGQKVGQNHGTAAKMPTGQLSATSMTGVPVNQPGVQAFPTMAQPVAQSAAQVAQPGAATAPLAQPVAQSAAPVAQPEAATASLAQPVAQPAASVAQLGTQPAATVAQPGVATAQVAQPGATTAPVAQPLARPTAPGTRPGTQPAALVSQPGVATPSVGQPAAANPA